LNEEAEHHDELGGRAPISLEDLQRWEDHGATWRALEVGDERAVVQLCTCYGEPVDLVRGEAPELIAFIRERLRAERR
jgi:hypothetical protein